MPRPPRDLRPDESALHFFGAELRHWRSLRNYSQDELGKLTLNSGDTIGKVEKAVRWPTEELAQRCDVVLETGGVLRRLLPLVLAERRSSRTGAAQSVSRRIGFSSAPALDSTVVDRLEEKESVVAGVMDAASSFPASQVVVSGPGGFGKSTLAIQVCHDSRVRERFSTILWVEVGERCTPARVVSLVADLCVHLGETRPAVEDPEQASFHLAQALGDRRVLLVVDNVWAADDLVPFVFGGPNCVRLITTRNVRVAPADARIERLGPMSVDQVRLLLSNSGSCDLPNPQLRHLAELCGGWPLLASVVGSSVSHDVQAGQTPARAVLTAESALLAGGPHAFDVWDADQRSSTIGRAITSSLSSLEDHVALPGGSALRERYLDLSIFPAATPIPLAALSTWWGSEHGWSATAVRQFCRTLNDRSLVGAYLADTDEIMLHDVFRACLRHLVGQGSIKLHKSFVDTFRAEAKDDWATLDLEHRYVWCHLCGHLHEAGLDEEVIDVLSDADYIVTKVCSFGQEPLVADRIALSAVESRATATRDGDVAVARAMVQAGYLVSGLQQRHDVAATLLLSIIRNVAQPSRAAERLRSIAAEADTGFEVQWVGDQVAPGDGHVGAVTAVAVDPGRVVSGGEDGTVKVWDRQSHQLIRTLHGHRGWVYTVAISTDADLIASAGDDRVIRLWQASTGRATGVLLGHSRRVRSLTFDRTGSRIVSGAEDGQVVVWDTRTTSRLTDMHTDGCPIWSVSIGVDDTVVAASGEDESIRLYDVASGQLTDERTLHREWVRAVRFAADAPLLASGSGDNTVRLWGVANGRLTPLRTTSVGSRVRCVAPSRRAEGVAAAGEDAVVHMLTADGPDQAAPMPAGVDWVRAVAVTDDHDVVAGCEDGATRVVRANGQVTELASGRDTVWSTAYADDGRLVLLGRSDGTIEINSARAGEPVRRSSAGYGRVWSLHSGGEFIAAACGDGRVRTWRLHDAEWLLTLNEDATRSWAVAVASSGSLLAATHAGTVRVWDLPAGRLRWERVAHQGRVRTVAFDGSDRIVATGGGDGSVRVWRVADGERLHEIASHGSWVRTVALDAPGRTVIIGYGSGDVVVHDLTGDKPLAHLFGHSGRVLAAAFAADRDLVVTAAADGTVRLWSASAQRQLAEIRVDASLQCAGFDHGAGMVLAGSSNGVAAIGIGESRLGE